MKRGTLLLFISLVLVLNLNLSSAINSCSDNSTLTMDSKEIDEGKVKSINGLHIGVERADDNAVFRKIFSDLLLDAQTLSLENTTVAASVNISSSSYTISLVSATDTRAVIRVNSANSDEIEEGDSETVSGLIVSLKSATQSGDVSSAEILVGAKRISLSSDKLYEKQIINNANYLIKLISASDTNAIVEVQKCATGEIQIEEQTQQPAQQNQTSNNTTSNQTTSNQTEINQTGTEGIENNNESSRQITVAEANERLRQMQEANNTNQSLSDQTDEETQKKQGFFRRFINWIKRLFTFGD